MEDYKYLLLSTLSYIKIKNHKKINFDKNSTVIADLFKNKIKIKKDKKAKFLKDKVAVIENYRIIDYKERISGLACYCLENEKGELIFSFRGTEIFDIRDLWTDFKILIGKKPYKLNQFNDAVDFVKSYIDESTYSKGVVYFTGHSLGGGIAQYCAYVISKSISVNCVTFNGVGVFKNIPKSYKLGTDDILIDYIFKEDLVGNFGEEVGIEKYVNTTKKMFKDFSKHGILNFYNYFNSEDGKHANKRINEEIIQLCYTTKWDIKNI